jgi:hypothetical protein
LLAVGYAAKQVTARDRGRILVSRGRTPLQRPRHVSLVLGSRTVSYNPPRHSGVGFRRDF